LEPELDGFPPEQVDLMLLPDAKEQAGLSSLKLMQTVLEGVGIVGIN
jgi:hypothetical protein